ncbi:hypothetical protein BCUN_1863 [Bifidobacterium cuniculi]|uniref:Uncharacterized protein n=1 Tax=Bifidobacterium cuniculi TaxID=1688 RepID=A0A087AFG5_9BIFI|nr:hypothetical protein BCUN_1863 [Bifidobacterium cuniculi]
MRTITLTPLNRPSFHIRRRIPAVNTLFKEKQLARKPTVALKTNSGHPRRRQLNETNIRHNQTLAILEALRSNADC